MHYEVDVTLEEIINEHESQNRETIEDIDDVLLKLQKNKNFHFLLKEPNAISSKYIQSTLKLIFVIFFYFKVWFTIHDS